MAKAPRRVYEITPAWPFGTPVVVEVAGWNVALTASVGFEDVERWYDKPLPTEARLHSKPRKQIPELILTGARTPVVSAGMKSVLEQVAPGESEFRPFTLQWEDGTAVPGEWHLCNLLKRIDCFDYAAMGMQPPDPKEVEKTLHQKRSDPMSAEEYWLREGYINQMLGPKYVDLATIDDAQIWRPRWHPASIFVTDNLLAALKRAKIRGLQAERLGTREEPLPTLAEIREKALSRRLKPKEPSTKTEA
ncbi:imm11 family protein [Bradyrhizobium cajani]|uniref:Immunity MXAN-0049 protein domain-containing protein n=1 Tax=Bradyrhizobium cajani TaxID=1928661 RepID=A0A844T1E5_9BRAD|nr:DUF1629 domain-containing protein [Bradyrhizobium cajani]MCP3370872.1 hypothetical protein [Bradyrhizobium cajani]MVT72096.1 hypothetical protein [Bradyrhizobium cajani]